MTTTYLVSDYKGWVRNRLDDASFPDAVLLQMLNDTNREICHLGAWQFLEKNYDGTTTQGYNWYNWLTDYQVVQDMTVTSPTGSANQLTYVDYRELDALYPAAPTNQGPPAIWSAWAGEFFLGPSPQDQAYTVRIRYIPEPLKLVNDSDVTNIPDAFSEALTLGVYRRALRYNDQYDEASFIDADFGAQIQIMKDRALARQLGQNRRTDSGRLPMNNWR